jgi:hypothetical protein
MQLVARSYPFRGVELPLTIPSSGRQKNRLYNEDCCFGLVKVNLDSTSLWLTPDISDGGRTSLARVANPEVAMLTQSTDWLVDSDVSLMEVC